MKKALIVANSSGMITLFLKNDFELLLERGYQIDCACNTDYPDSNTDAFFQEYGINVMHVDFPIRDLNFNKVKSSYLALNGILKQCNYNVIHCHSTIAAVLARQCGKKYRNKGIKIIYTSHGFPFYEGAIGKSVGLFKMIENYYSRYTDAIITICNEDYENAKKMHCKNIYKINGVGIDLAKFDLQDFDREEYRKKLGFNQEEIIILSVGELNTNKNHQIIIRAIGELKDNRIKYAICGREVTEKGKKQELAQLAQERGVDLRFLGFRKDIPEVCASVDIGAIPSLKEGLGLAGVEMLASGIPVVGSKRQGIKDYVIDGVTGILADPTDEKSFAEGIMKALLLRNDRKVKEACHKQAQQFNKAYVRTQMKSIYDRLNL